MELKRGEDSILDQIPVISSDVSSQYGEVALSKLLPVNDQQKHGKIKRKQKTKKHYVTDKVVYPDDKERAAKVEIFPYGYPKDLAVFAHDVMTKAWRNDERIKQLKLKCTEKTNNRGVKPRDLHVEEPPIDSTKTVCDVDPHYFKVIETKPEKVNMKDYIQTLRDSLRTKIVIGYLEDDTILLEERLLLEQKMLEIIQENYQKYVNIFEEFLYKDHMSSKQLLEESEESAQAAFDKYEEYKLIARKLSALRSIMYITEEKWRYSKTYQKFLYSASPAFWRATQSSYKRASIFIRDEPEDELNIFGTYRQSIKDKNVSIIDMIRVFYRDSRNEKPPQLYFTRPDQLLAVFRLLEMQNLNALLHCEELAEPISIVKNGLIEADKLLTRQIQGVQETIKKLETSILWEENNTKHSRELAQKLLDDQFRKVVIDKDVLDLKIFVEDVYESRIGANIANLGMLEMMTEIECKYNKELLDMENTPSLELAFIQITCFQEEIMVMQLAERATKQFAEMQREIARFNRSYDPPFKKPGGKQVKKRSPVKSVKVNVAHIPTSNTDDDYLEYFTDCCRSTDNLEDYGIRHEVALVSIPNEENTSVDWLCIFQ